MKRIIILVVVLVGIIIFSTCSKDESSQEQPAQQYQLNVQVLPANGGAVSPSSGTFQEGEQVTITATPSSERYDFNNWTGDATGSPNTFIVTMNANKNITANFMEIAPVYTNGEGVVGALGGTVRIDDESSPLFGAYVIIPEGALENDTFIKIELNEDIEFSLDPSLKLIEFKPDGLEFLLDVEIGIPYSETFEDISNLTLINYILDPETLTEMPKVQINSDLKIMSANTNHFSYYTVWDREVFANINPIKVDGKIGAKIMIGGDSDFGYGLEGIRTLLNHDYVNSNQCILDESHGDAYSVFRLSLFEKKIIGWRHVEGASIGFGVKRQFNALADRYEVFIYNLGESEALLIANNLIDDAYGAQSSVSSWMSGAPILFWFNEFTPDPNKEYVVGASWVLSYGNAFATFNHSRQYDFFDTDDRFELAELDDFNGSVYNDYLDTTYLDYVDQDGDGVFNIYDECANTPIGESVDENGCTNLQLDDDSDGVQNGDDECPETPADVSVDENGCADSQLDNDGDGVNNNLDQCPNTPIGENVNANGCAESELDEDDDGVNDVEDQCPNTPNGELVSALGCSDSQLDYDGDGVYNSQDQCPNTPQGETVDSNGCMINQGSVTDIDGNTYPIVQIGTQVWMTENLKTTKFANGDEINYLSYFEWTYPQEPVYSMYDNSTDYMDEYGLFYNWTAAIDIRGVCPEGWHVPSMDEFSDLISFLGGDNIAGGKLKESGFTHWNNPNEGATNESGFTSLGGGIINSGNLVASGLGNVTRMWSSNSKTGLEIRNNTAGVSYINNGSGSWGYCIRCVSGYGDSDNDGVQDNFDICPNTNVGETVNPEGCSINQLDEDNDGVIDNDDQCPETTLGETVNEFGCSESQLDNDSDGIPNNIDLCPNTQIGASVNSNGCSSFQLEDSDNDGVLNYLDQCPYTPSGENVNNVGCSDSQLDDDFDGVPNNLDDCPNTQFGVNVTSNGCSSYQLSDDDGDGVQNYLDECPNTPEGTQVDSVGCPLDSGYTVTDVDGNTYNTVQIGNQIWMKENLKTTKYKNGDNIPQITDEFMPAYTSTGTGAYKNYNNDIGIAEVYGRHYNWFAVSDSRGICPEGWRAPNNSDFITLINNVGGISGGGNLKETGLSHWSSPNTGATNSYGFKALGSGGIGITSQLDQINNSSNLWSITSGDSSGAYYMRLAHDSNLTNYWGQGNTEGSIEIVGFKYWGYCVRCIKD